MRFILLGVVISFLVACGNESAETNYFPLEEGLSWQYRVTSDFINRIETEDYSVTNMGAVDLTGDYQGQRAYIRRNSHGTDYYIVQDDSGSYRIAKRTVVELKPRFDKEKRLVLPNIEQDKTRLWSIESRPYILRGVENLSLPNPKIRSFVMASEISATDVRVRVPAGVFENCIEVTGRGDITLYVDPRLGYQDISITQKEWYAPGVGLVKLVRDEPLDLAMFKGGKITFELVNFDG